METPPLSELRTLLREAKVDPVRSHQARKGSVVTTNPLDVFIPPFEAGCNAFLKAVQEQQSVTSQFLVAHMEQELALQEAKLLHPPVLSDYTQLPPNPDLRRIEPEHFAIFARFEELSLRLDAIHIKTQKMATEWIRIGSLSNRPMSRLREFDVQCQHSELLAAKWLKLNWRELEQEFHGLDEELRRQQNLVVANPVQSACDRLMSLLQQWLKHESGRLRHVDPDVLRTEFEADGAIVVRSGELWKVPTPELTLLLGSVRHFGLSAAMRRISQETAEDCSSLDSRARVGDVLEGRIGLELATIRGESFRYLDPTTNSEVSTGRAGSGESTNTRMPPPPEPSVPLTDRQTQVLMLTQERSRLGEGHPAQTGPSTMRSLVDATGIEFKHNPISPVAGGNQVRGAMATRAAEVAEKLTTDQRSVLRWMLSEKAVDSGSRVNAAKQRQGSKGLRGMQGNQFSKEVIKPLKELRLLEGVEQGPKAGKWLTVLGVEVAKLC